MKNILVLTDFTIRSINAAEFAVQLAIQSKANIILCNVLETTTSLTVGTEMKWPVVENSAFKNESICDLTILDKRLKKIIAESEALFKPDINFLSETGFLSDVTDKIIRHRRVDMVVIGAHKSSAFARLIFGSHTHILLDKLKCPILLVPINAKFKGINQIIYATDQSFDDSKVIDYLVKLAEPFHASVLVNHISKTGDNLQEQEISMEDTHGNNVATTDSPVYFNTIKGNNVKKSLIKMIDAGEVDIVTLVHKQYDLFTQIFHNSISKHIADSTQVPLLIMPHTYNVETSDFTPKRLDHYLFETAQRNDIR